MNYTLLYTLLAGFIIGFAFGTWQMFHRIFRKKNGTLHIDQRDPKTDRYNLEFDTDLNEIPKLKFVIFKIHTISTRENSSL